MSTIVKLAAAAAAAAFIAVPAAAQQSPDQAAAPATTGPAPATIAPTEAPAPAAAVATPAAVSAPAPAAPQQPQCELHVWPTENYLGMNSGLLSGFGIIGAIADQAAHKDHVTTVKDQMREYLGPEVQMATLNHIGIADALRLKGYKIVVEEPTPFNEDVKKDPALKAKADAMNARIKAKQRLSASTNPCYAELITTDIFYFKAMMYGSNLFTGWIYRDFGNQPTARWVAKGAVKNPLGVFPPKTPDQVEAAKAELIDAFGKDFREYVDKKVYPPAAN